MVVGKKNLPRDRKGLGKHSNKNSSRVDFSCVPDVVKNTNIESKRRGKELQAPDLRNASKNKAVKFTPTDFDWIQTIRECPVYHPSIEEFDDPLVYLQKISPEASKYGICKVVPPLVSSTPAGVVLMKEKKGFKFTTNVQPLRLAERENGDYITFFTRGRYYTLRDFENVANKAMARRYCTSGSHPSRFLEREFWNELSSRKKGMVEYGVNVEGSAFSCIPDDQLAGSKWNLKTLPKLPSCTLRHLENCIPGITEPMLFIGMLFSFFSWHVEDHYLYSINFHHCGAPKTWYGVPGHASRAFEKVAQHSVCNQEILSKGGEDGVSGLLAEKTTIFPPHVLLQNDVAVYRTVQMPGEFIVTFPRAYHAGFSHGFNCGEAVNFADGDWFSFGAEASQRYASLGRMPIIPFEELLCKEAMHLWKFSSHQYHSEESPSWQCVKISFACLLRTYHFMLWALIYLKAFLSFPPKDEGTIYCVLCKRDCYVAHITCQCYPVPICLFHETEICGCTCGSSCNLFLRKDINEMERVAEMFEQEEAIHLEVERQMKQNAALRMQNILSHVEQEYIPYSKVLADKNGRYGDMSLRGSRIKCRSSDRVKKRKF